MARLSDMADLAKDEAPGGGEGGGYSASANLKAEARALLDAHKADDAEAYAAAFKRMHEMCGDDDEGADALGPADEDEDY